MHKGATPYTSEILSSQRPCTVAVAVGAEIVNGRWIPLTCFMGPKQIRFIQCLKIKIFLINSGLLDSHGKKVKRANDVQPIVSNGNNWLQLRKGSL